jgi:hypothetical protein
MPVRIAPNQIQNPQQIEAIVTGPADANRLFVIDGQFDAGVFAGSQGAGFVQQKETFSVLIGPGLTRRQFCGAIATIGENKFQHQCDASKFRLANFERRRRLG